MGCAQNDEDRLCRRLVERMKAGVISSRDLCEVGVSERRFLIWCEKNKVLVYEGRNGKRLYYGLMRRV